MLSTLLFPPPPPFCCCCDELDEDEAQRLLGEVVGDDGGDEGGDTADSDSASAQNKSRKWEFISTLHRDAKLGGDIWGQSVAAAL